MIAYTDGSKAKPNVLRSEGDHHPTVVSFFLSRQDGMGPKDRRELKMGWDLRRDLSRRPAQALTEAWQPPMSSEVSGAVVTSHGHMIGIQSRPTPSNSSDPIFQKNSSDPAQVGGCMDTRRLDRFCRRTVARTHRQEKINRRHVCIAFLSSPGRRPRPAFRTTP